VELTTIPDSVWLELAQAAAWSMRARQSIRTEVYNHFARHIYRVWPHTFAYQNNHPGGPDVGWVNAVLEWQDIERAPTIAHALGDHSIGRAASQDDPRNPLIGARLGEYYGNRERDRVQFLVLRGGGLVLLNRMRRACQLYLGTSGAAQTVVMAWKVFGEDVTRTRNHCCVIYLGRKFDDPAVEQVLRVFIWPQVMDLIDRDFQPAGMYRVANLPFWAMRMPTPEREQLIFSTRTQGSVERLMGLVLGQSFEQAVKVVGSDDNLRALMEAAKKAAQELVARLYSH
jgi:hypothetical protein